jgi:cell division septation protein DedD
MEDDQEYGERDREISLGTSFIIGIFFALVLICAIFFAFGYSLGRRSALPASGVPDSAVATGTSSKPASGTLAAQSVPAASSRQASYNADSSTDSDSDSSAANPVIATTKAPSAVVLPTKPAARPTPVSKPVPAPAATPGVALPIVQVAAISRQGDADMLLSALKRKGYNAVVHQVPQDKLFHIQLGPFATKKDAEAMRQRLIADGYNAIVK